MKKIYKVVWNQGDSLAKMIRAGHYPLFNQDINDWMFQRSSSGFEAELILVHLGSVSLTKARNNFESQGHEPADVKHLIAFGAAYPEIQKEFHIATLGDKAHYYCGLLYRPATLSCHYSERLLSLGSPCDDLCLNDSWRYLSVIKQRT